MPGSGSVSGACVGPCPSFDRLPSTLSAPDLSAGVVRGFIGTMQPSTPPTFRSGFGSSPSRTDPGPPWRLRAAGGLPGSDTILDGSNWSQTPVERVPRRTVPHMLPAAVRSASASTVRIFRSSIQSSSSRCVRFATIVTDDPATLATGRALPPTRTGLPPAGSRQLRLAHANRLLISPDQRRSSIPITRPTASWRET